jgi:hypothetical protein
MALQPAPQAEHLMMFITRQKVRPDGYVNLSDSNSWTRWLHGNVPERIHRIVTGRLVSNLKHLLVGLELKAALIGQHHYQAAGERPVLFEPYFQNLILEFCVASFSVFEGLGSAHWLDQIGRDGADGPKIQRNQWLPALAAVYDATGEHGLVANVENTLAVRDRLSRRRAPPSAPCCGARRNWCRQCRTYISNRAASWWLHPLRATLPAACSTPIKQGLRYRSDASGRTYALRRLLS